MVITPEQLAKSGSEHGHQAALFAWAAQNLTTYPELKWLFAIPNGGQRSASQGARLRAEGVKRGVPDIMLPCRNGRYNGLWLEMKVGKNVLTREQKDYFNYLHQENYRCKVCYSWIEARDEILKYFNGYLGVRFLRLIE
jgi:hypothetical protein